MTDREQMNDMLEELLAMHAELDGAIAQMKALEDHIRAFALSTGETGDVPGVEVVLRNGYDRKVWNTDALMNLAAFVPQVMDCLQYRDIKPTAAIVFEKEKVTM